MKKLLSLVLATLAVFFMAGCDQEGEQKIEDLLPELELVGDSVMEVEQYSDFVDPGVGIIGDFELDAVVVSNVDTTMVGDYTITYTITYLDIEYEISRTVRVVELGTVITPGIQLTGDTVMEVEQFTTFVDPGVGILGGLDLNAVIDSDVNTDVIGSYTITYTITYMEIDYVVTRTVNVVAATLVVTSSIELIGDASMEVEQYSAFVDPGATIIGDFTGVITVESTVDTYTMGVYTIVYSYTYENIAYSVSRTVTVVMEKLVIFPSILLVGDEQVEVVQYTEYVDPGVSILGDVTLDVIANSTVDTNTVGTYTIIYSYTYGAIYYSLTRTVVVVAPPPLFELSLELEEVTENSITVNVDYEDNDGVVSNTIISIYKDAQLLESYSFKLGNDDVEFTDLDDNTMYFIEITGDYELNGEPAVLAGYFLNVKTNEIVDLSFAVLEPSVGLDSIDFGIEITDPASILTNLVVNVYLDGTIIRTVELFDEIYIGEVEANLAMVWANIDGLTLNTDYLIEVEYTYNSPGSAGDVTLQLAKVAYKTLEMYMPPVVSNDCNERYYALYCEIDIDFTDFDSYYYVVAKLFEDGVYKKQMTLTDNYTTYEFEYLSDNTDYTIEVYATYTHTATQGGFSGILLGTYEVKTILSGSLATPTIENLVVTNTGDTITVDFDFIDNELAMERGLVYLQRGWSAVYEEIVVGHNSIVFSENIEENTLYTISIKVDDTGNGSMDTYHEESIYIPPVITIDSFEPAKMFFLGDSVVMKLTLDNDEDYDITAVTINGTRYETFKFPSDTEVMFIDLGMKLVATYPIALQNIIITYDEVEYVIAETSSADATVYAVGSVDPVDSKIVVIDIIPQKFRTTKDRDNPNAVTSILTDIYLDNDYNLPITSITIGGIVYSGDTLTVVTPTHLLVNARFAYNAISNDNLYFSNIKYMRNGVEITGTEGGHSSASIYDYEIGEIGKANVIHISTPQQLIDIDRTGNDYNTVYILDNDIDMAGINFIPIGTYDDHFAGMFDGNGHTISNITINRTFAADNELNYVGIFGYSSALIVNLTLDNINITVHSDPDNYLYVGILSGYLAGDAYNVHVINSSITIDGIIKGAIGGLFGKSSGDILRTSTDTDITIVDASMETTSMRLYVGGLIGVQTYGDVRQTSAHGDISIVLLGANDVFVGGLIGFGGEYVANSFTTGNITTTGNYYSRIGGLIGDTGLGQEMYVYNCFTTGDIHATAGSMGGLIGETWGHIHSSFATGTITGDNGSIGKLFGKGSSYGGYNVLLYRYDGQLAYRDTTEISGADTHYGFIGTASATEFNSVEYYIDFLGWSPHFFDFSNLDIENGDVPIFAIN